MYSLGKDWTSFASSDQLENVGGTLGGGASGQSYPVAADVVWVSRGRSDRSGSEFDDLFPEKKTVFHWHGDTFTIPHGAIRLAESDACVNQGFLYQGRVLALQFHLETTPASAEALIENCGHEIVPAPYIQSVGEMVGDGDEFHAVNELMAELLAFLTARAQS